MALLDALKESVRKIEQQGDATIALLRGIAQQLRDHAGEEAEINAIAAQLDAQAAEFQAAIDENTPAEPE